MNELCSAANTAVRIRKTLLATASALVLAAHGESAQAADADRPTVWIEGGWHFENVTGESDPFIPPLNASTRATGLPSLTSLEKTLAKTYGGEGSISFQPKGSDWVFSASARYGRVQTARQSHNDKKIVGPRMITFVNTTANGGHGNFPVTPTFNAYIIGSSSNSETHTVVDFQVGRDIGIGLLGRGSDSIISFGARYAQMNAKSKAQSHANPDVRFVQFSSINFLGLKYRVRDYYTRSAAFVERSDSSQALGPSLSLKNTTGLLGTVDDGQLAFDWGVNAAILFGRQKAQSSHHSTFTYLASGFSTNAHPAVTRSRSHMVMIPNIGGFAGLSYRFPNAKLSAGYRADFFFGARDGGLETRNTTDVGFHGPYATISIGLGG